MAVNLPALRVGFVGLGRQGAPMARRILAAGFPLTVWARRPDAVAPFRDAGARVAETLVELGAASDVVGVCVDDDVGVWQVVAAPHGLLAGMGPGGVILVHSTVHPRTCVDLAQAASGMGVSVLDTPVSGGPPAADEGRLLVVVGGDQAAFERVQPVLAAYAERSLRVGPVGAGQAAKLVNNLVFAAGLGAVQRASVLAQALGVGERDMLEVLASGSAAGFASALVRQAGGLANLAAAEPLLRKDLALIAEVTATRGGGTADLIALAEHALTAMEPGPG